MPQRRPRRPGRPADPAGVRPVEPATVDGWHYQVDGHGLETFKRAVSESDSDGVAAVRDVSTSVPIGDARTDIGRAGLQQAAADAGTPRSAGTVHRWARQDRIPDARVAELVQRRALVARLGGPARFAERLGVSVSRVRRWQSGRTEAMRGPAAAALVQARLDDARERAGMGQIRGARIWVTAQVEYRSHGSTSFEHRGARTIDIDLSEPDAQTVADALIAGDSAKAMAVCESAWSEWYNHRYSDAAGVHVLDTQDFGIEWT